MKNYINNYSSTTIEWWYFVGHLQRDCPYEKNVTCWLFFQPFFAILLLVIFAYLHAHLNLLREWPTQLLHRFQKESAKNEAIDWWNLIKERKTKYFLFLNFALVQILLIHNFGSVTQLNIYIWKSNKARWILIRAQSTPNRTVTNSNTKRDPKESSLWGGLPRGAKSARFSKFKVRPAKFKFKIRSRTPKTSVLKSETTPRRS